MPLHPSVNVISEVIDGEAVVIDLKDGCYYSFNETGSRVWTEIERGADVAAIVCALAQRYAVPDLDLTQDVDHLVGQLLQERLVVDDGAAGPPVTPGVPGTEPFVAPTFQKYVDMQDLILLDPVHEVDHQQGWPLQRPGMPSGRPG